MELEEVRRLFQRISAIELGQVIEGTEFIAVMEY